MSPRTERAFIKSARLYHSAPVTRIAVPDQPARYPVALDPWDNPDRAAREMDRDALQAQLRRRH